MALVILGAMLAPWLFLLTARRGAHVGVRNAFVRGAAVGGWALAAVHEPMFAPLGLSVLLRWSDASRLTAVAIWAAIVGVWFVGQLLQPSALIAAAWLTLAVGNCVLLVLQALGTRGRLPEALAAGVDGMVEYAGTFGQRTACAAYLALALPLCWLAPTPWRWALVAALTVGLWLTSSWLAWLATGTALAVLLPGARLPILGLEALALLVGVLALWSWAQAPAWYFWVMRRTLDRWTVRGSSLDSVVQRFAVWAAYGRAWRRWPNWLLGRGDGSALEEAVVVQAGIRERMIGYPHNELVTLAYEHGCFGLLAVALFAWRVAPALQAGDPWSATVVAGGVLMLGMHAGHIAPVGGPWWLAAAMVAGR